MLGIPVTQLRTLGGSGSGPAEKREAASSAIGGRDTSSTARRRSRFSRAQAGPGACRTALAWPSGDGRPLREGIEEELAEGGLRVDAEGVLAPGEDGIVAEPF